jgi:hypothetical protein
MEMIVIDPAKADAKADSKFLRRIFLTLVMLTTLAGAMAGIATVHAMNSQTGSCQLFCE